MLVIVVLKQTLAALIAAAIVNAASVNYWLIVVVIAYAHHCLLTWASHVLMSQLKSYSFNLSELLIGTSIIFFCFFVCNANAISGLKQRLSKSIKLTFL